MSGNYERGKHAEEIAAKWLEAKFGFCFSKKSLPVGIKNDGRVALHSFDLVSDDDQIVAEVKSHQMTKSGNIPSAKISDTYHACNMLEKVKAEEKLLILTDRSFFDIFKRYSDGKISDKIEITYVPYGERLGDCGVKVSSTQKKKITTGNNEDFNIFWSELSSWLAEKPTITNWTLKSGQIGEDFEAGPVSGNYVEIRPPSALTYQKVPRKDFELIFENWDAYLNQEISRGDLAKMSRFTKYTISIIHQYLSSQ